MSHFQAPDALSDADRVRKHQSYKEDDLPDMHWTDKLFVSHRSEANVKASARRKTRNLGGGAIKRVRRLFNAKTDTEAIQQALRKAVEDREIEESLDRLLKEGRFRRLYR